MDTNTKQPIIHRYKGHGIQRGITERDFAISKEGSPLDCHFFQTLWEAKEAIDNLRWPMNKQWQGALYDYLVNIGAEDWALEATAELLRACKSMLQEMETIHKQDGGCDHTVGICWCAYVKKMEQAEKAIAKAEGRATNTTKGRG